MKRLATIAGIVVLLLALAVPAFADSLGSAEPTPTPPAEEPTTEPGGGTEEPTTEPEAEETETEVPVVDTAEETQDGGGLADTGIDAATLALIAGGLLLAGGLGLFAARRSGKVN